MFIKVRLLNGFQKTLTYKIPDNWGDKNLVDTLVDKIVCVPIKNRELAAIVLQQFGTLSEQEKKFEIREVIRIESFPDDKNYNNFINSLCQYYQIDKFHFIQRVKGFLTQEKLEIIPEVIAGPEIAIEEDTPENISIIPAQVLKNNNFKNKVNLTQEQQVIVDFLQNKIIAGVYEPTLLHGVTGSGKTEIYKKLIITCIENNKSALLLLPEVTLAIQFEKIMRAQLPENISIHSFHSATGVKAKKNTWDLLLKGKPVLIIGVHIPVILPIANLGFIIVDEEHESGYQEKKHPKINSKDAAIMRAHENKIPILLGSATPSVSSLYNVKTKNWNFFSTKK
jgi:Primosomal protein N'' (replication factor Y) - superfamily II helicase